MAHVKVVSHREGWWSARLPLPLHHLLSLLRPSDCSLCLAVLLRTVFHCLCQGPPAPPQASAYLPPAWLGGECRSDVIMPSQEGQNKGQSPQGHTASSPTGPLGRSPSPHSLPATEVFVVHQALHCRRHISLLGFVSLFCPFPAPRVS